MARAIEVLNEAQSGVGYVGAIRRKGNVVWAVGGSWGSPLVMTSDGGRKFRRRKAPEVGGLRDVLPLGDARALVVGENGGVFETRDAETWNKIATSTGVCLFAIERALGMMWIAGEDAFLLSSADGVAWRRVRTTATTKPLGRIQRLKSALGAMWMLGYAGRMAVMKDADREAKLVPIESERALTGIAFSPRGVGVVVGDGGTIFRSTNRGVAWTRVETSIEQDIEDVAWHDGRFVAVGAGGLVLASEDGESFSRVDSGRDEHLWSVTSDGAHALVGGDGGLLLGATTAALEGARPIESAREAEDDSDDAPDEPDAVRLAEKPIDAAELDAASARWIDEGKKFYASLNAFVAQFYEPNAPKLADEPEEPRKDMATLVQRAAVQLNREKRFDDLRRMFPPSYEAFDYEHVGRTIQPALYADDDSIVARVDGVVRRIARDAIETMPTVRAFGRSRDRRHFALAFDDRIEIRAGLENVALVTLGLPKKFDARAIRTIDVFPDGERVLLATETHVSILSQRGELRLHPDGGDARSYVHAALSPDGRTIACGDQDSAHRILVSEGGAFVLGAQVEPASSYPCFAAFHDDGAHLALSSCHFARSATLGLELGVLAKKKKKALALDARSERVNVIDDRRWMYSAISRDGGFLFGDRNGYAWLVAFDGTVRAYFHVGSTMTAMDLSADGRRFLMGTCAGILAEIDREAPPDEYKVHSLKRGAEIRRWVFWRGFPDLVW